MCDRLDNSRTPFESMHDTSVLRAHGNRPSRRGCILDDQTIIRRGLGGCSEGIADHSIVLRSVWLLLGWYCSAYIWIGRMCWEGVSCGVGRGRFPGVLDLSIALRDVYTGPQRLLRLCESGWYRDRHCRSRARSGENTPVRCRECREVFSMPLRAREVLVQGGCVVWHVA